MRPLEGFKDAHLVRGLAERIRADLGGRRLRLMEVCGTHTMAMFRHGLRDLLEDTIELLSGPGCPVCVTPNGYLDRAIEIARRHDDVTIATFGDMLRVPGSESTLERERAAGADVRVVYSPLDAVELAAADGRRVVFLGVGFETTTPLVASSILEAERRKIPRFTVLAAHKRVPPALDVLAGDPEIAVDGFILPGHVSVIIGSRAYASVPERFGIPCVVTGFEPLDMVSGIHRLVRQHIEGRAEVEIAYSRAVTPEGIWKARSVLDAVFEVGDAEWRGIGVIPGTGYDIQETFAHRDAARVFPVDLPPAKENPACLCGEVLKGKVTPPECALFSRACTPDSPTGPCMVSSEGTCAAWYKYGRRA
jgi:hydrogenase expression/formation protein HypD